MNAGPRLTRVHLGALSAAVASTLALLACQDGQNEIERPAAQPPKYSSPPSPSEVELGTRHVVFISPDFDQYVDYETGGTVLVIQEEERDPNTGVWSSSTSQYSASFAINFVAARAPDELYVFGTKRNGDDVIERWHLNPVQGSWTATRQTATSPIGVSLTASGTLSVSLLGGNWLEPGSRTPLAEYREEIYIGNDFGGVRYATVDPEGRFLLVLTPQSDKLYQLPLPQAGESVTPSLIYDDGLVPELAYMGCIEPRHEQAAGRMYVMTTANNELEPTIDRRLVLTDPDNDGVFDSIFPLSHDQFQEMGFVWTETFVGPPSQ